MTSDPHGQHQGEPPRPGSGGPPPDWGPPQPTPYGITPGSPPPGHPAYIPGPPRPINPLGIAGFVTGLLGLLLCWVPFLGLVLAATGVALSGVGLAQGRRSGASTGLAIAGLVCGALGLIPALIILFLVLVASSP